MKMIFKGKVPEEEVYRTTCYHCRSVYEYKAKEVKRVNDQRDGDYFTFDCQLCGKQLTQDVNHPYKP